VLKHCLGSLAAQTALPKELIIINNSSIDSTPQIIKNFQNNVSFTVKLFTEKRSLYPVIYNRGLKEAGSKWVAFIDDDCVADLNWVESIQRGIRDYPKSAALVGNSKTYYDNDIYALTTWMLDKLWKTEGRVGRVIYDFATLDNKNIVYNKNFLKEKSIKYDKNRKVYKGAAEDADLGLQILAIGGAANYLSEMIIFHKDPRSWGDFWRKAIHSQKAFNTLYSKWGSKINHYSVKTLSFSQKFQQYLNPLPLPLIKKFTILLLLMLTGYITNNFIKHENS